MLDKIPFLKKYISKSKPQTFGDKRIFRKEFYSKPHHHWIKDDKYLKRNFDRFIEILPIELINHIWSKRPIAFIPANGRLSCAINSNEHMSFILIYKDLQQILNSGYPDRGLAILTHEIGHLFYRHDERNIDPLEAQVEADRLCVMLGLGRELQEVLLDSATGIESRVRISKLTAEILTGDMDN
ncbi:MAG: hypothetical protein KC493_01150 [Bacteriovoracaceae bacterium]|nr:hypothetical protein [Bacteriovoracaceae bacterium]